MVDGNRANTVGGWECLDLDIYKLGFEGDLYELRKMNQDGLYMAQNSALAGPHIIAGLLDRIEALHRKAEIQLRNEAQSKAGEAKATGRRWESSGLEGL